MESKQPTDYQGYLTIGFIFAIFGMAQWQFLYFGIAFLILGTLLWHRSTGK